MSHYSFTETFRSLYDKAVALYAGGQRGADTFFTPEATAWLAANGLTAQYLYDYAEDQNNYGEPGYDLALGIELIRRDYFLNVQHGKPTGNISDPETWPAKDAAIRDITWLPRILPKTRAKLRGELPASMMYGCGGDRKFFKAHDINPVEFLSLVWRHLDNDEAIIDWVVQRSTLKT
ncbi:MAG TPA: DUF5069 domain-containing protein [Rariglobus sp.]|jgi:hypothetical protein|nr:DUF5069 domain-containing protein [Rariglobus sp.]